MRRMVAFALMLLVALSGAPSLAFANASAKLPAGQCLPTPGGPPCPGMAQEAGKVVGVLKDANGKPIQNATVNIMQGDKLIATVTTDANGLFSAANLPAGSYTIQASSAGMALTTASTAITVTAGATTTVAVATTATGALAVTAGSAGFIAALGGPVIATGLALGAGGLIAVGIKQALDEASGSR
jgi:hypothetical protein